MTDLLKAALVRAAEHLAFLWFDGTDEIWEPFERQNPTHMRWYDEDGGWPYTWRELEIEPHTDTFQEAARVFALAFDAEVARLWDEVYKAKAEAQHHTEGGA
jgi:hypothetical protein